MIEVTNDFPSQLKRIIADLNHQNESLIAALRGIEMEVDRLERENANLIDYLIALEDQCSVEQLKAAQAEVPETEG